VRVIGEVCYWFIRQRSRKGIRRGKERKGQGFFSLPVELGGNAPVPSGYTYAVGDRSDFPDDVTGNSLPLSSPNFGGDFHRRLVRPRRLSRVGRQRRLLRRPGGVSQPRVAAKRRRRRVHRARRETVPRLAGGRHPGRRRGRRSATPEVASGTGSRYGGVTQHGRHW